MLIPQPCQGKLRHFEGLHENGLVVEDHQAHLLVGDNGYIGCAEQFDEGIVFFEVADKFAQDGIVGAGRQGGRLGDCQSEDKQRRRELVFDEDLGEVVAKRRRKGGRKSDWNLEDWELENLDVDI